MTWGQVNYPHHLTSHVVSPVVYGWAESLNFPMSKNASLSYQFRTIIDHGQYGDRPAKAGRSHIISCREEGQEMNKQARLAWSNEPQ